MSDIDDELLELVAGSDSKKRKKSKSKGSVSKRRKTEDSDSDQDDEVDLYPLEGKYIDENDRERLMNMSELEREAIIEKRLEEKDKKNQSQKLSEFFAANQSDNVANAAKRQHTARGATKEKDKKLTELKAKRKAKADNKRYKDGSPKRDRSSSPMMMETDDEEEDGQISKYDNDDDRDSGHDNEPATLNDMMKCWLPRDVLIKHYARPWFEDLVKGAYVRYLIGQEDSGPVYRLCEVAGIGDHKPYKIEDKTFEQGIHLKHGTSTKLFSMDKVSNKPFQMKEFERLVKTCETESVRLPYKQELEKKNAQIHKLSSQTMTESDVAAMIARKTQSLAQKATGLSTLEKSRLHQARILAERRHDFEEVAQIDAKLAEFEAFAEDTRMGRKDEDVLVKLSERNRRANSEAVRKAELMEAERRRRERKLALTRKSGTATPTDPSARLRTVPRTMMNNTSSPSRSGTPTITGDSLTVPPEPQEKRSASPLGHNLFESTVVNSIEVDLGDF